MARPDNQRLREQREQVVRRYIAAENSGDLDAMIASFHHPHYQVVPMGVISDGDAAVREFIAGLVRGFPDFHFEPLSVHHADEAVIVEARMTGTHVYFDFATLQRQLGAT